MCVVCVCECVRVSVCVCVCVNVCVCMCVYENVCNMRVCACESVCVYERNSSAIPVITNTNRSAQPTRATGPYNQHTEQTHTANTLSRHTQPA